jgi:uncharacterized protein (TIGR02145 family)
MGKTLAVWFFGGFFLLSMGNFLLSGSLSGGSTAFAESGGCGAYTAPGVWKRFDCYNLAAIGRTTNHDPFTPSWWLIGGYWQWGLKGPSPSQWHDTNTRHFAHGPTGPKKYQANSGKISGWDQTDAPDGAWSDSHKTGNDPCPAGFRIPTIKQWGGVFENNKLQKVGTWSDPLDSDPTNYRSALFLGDNLMLPAAGGRYRYSGALFGRGYFGHYWSSSENSSNDAWGLGFYSRVANTNSSLRRYGFSVRCVAE